MSKHARQEAPTTPIGAGMEILRKHGLAAFFACLAFYFGFWLVNEWLEDQRAFRKEVAAEVRALATDVDHLARIVDLSCRPPRERGVNVAKEDR